MKADFNQLLRDASQSYRRYQAGQSMEHATERAMQMYASRFPDQEWSQHIREISPGWSNPNPNGEDVLAVYETRALVRWGKSDVNQLHEALGVELPAWMIDFYAHVVCAFLPMLNQISIFTVEEAIAYEMKRREMHGENGTPCRLIRFANGDPTGLGFSLYQRLGSKDWGIVATDYFTAITPRKKNEEWSLDETDADITEWLRRMLATDGHPLIIENEFEPMAWRRVDAEQDEAS